MSANGYTTVDRRQKLQCACNCGQEATLDHFRVVELNERKSLVLPACESRFREEHAARTQLRQLVTRPKSAWARLTSARQVYRLQRFLTERNGSRKTALRTAAIYLLGQRAGLWMALLWKR